MTDSARRDAQIAQRCQAGRVPQLDERPQLDEVTEIAASWSTVVWDDPVNLMSYVSFVFRSYFGFSRSTAEKLMLQVHNEGRAIVASGGREEMERHVTAMHGYGLTATLLKAEG